MYDTEKIAGTTINIQHSAPANLEAVGIPTISHQGTKQPSFVRSACVIGGIGLIAGLGVGIPLGASVNSQADRLFKAEAAAESAKLDEKRLQWEIDNFCDQTTNRRRK